MKVLLKSLEELKYEYGIEEIDGYLIIGSSAIVTDILTYIEEVSLNENL